MAGWVQIPGGLTQISVGSSTNVWGVNAAGNIWRYTGNDANPWVQIAGGLSDIGVGSDGTVWGVNAAGNIWRYENATNSWVQISGALTRISVGSSTNVWGVNAAGNIWRYENATNSWVQIPGALSDIGVGSDGTVWGVNAAGNIFRYTTMRNKGASLLQDQVLNGDDYLLSPNGLYIAYMQDDGNFVLYHASSTQPPDVDWSRPYWSTGTSIRQQGFAKMQSDGNFVLYHGTPSNQGTPYWASNTNRVGAGSYHLDMQSDGNLVVYNGSTPLWASNTNWVSQQVTSGVHCLQTGQWMSNDTYLVSPNGQYVAYMQDDSNFVLYHATSTQPPNPDWSRPYWSVYGNASSNLVGKAQPGKYVARMQDDGNFVLYNGTDPGHFSGPYWASNTNRGAGSYHLDMQSDGNLVVYNGSTPLWASNTVAGVGERLNIVSGNNQTQPRFLTVYGGWPANFAPLSVVFTDSVGNPYAGKQITWTFYTPNWQMIVDIPPYGGMQTSIPVPTTTDSHGNATVNAVSAYTTDGSDGSFTIVAKSDSGLSVTFNLTIGGLRSVVSGTILAGNNQSVARSPNASFDVPVAIFAPLQVKVLKPDGTPAVGVRVGFVTGSNPDDIVTTTMNVDYNTVTTDGSGIATLSSVTAYDRTGTFTVVASIEGGNQLTFSETVSS